MHSIHNIFHCRKNIYIAEATPQFIYKETGAEHRVPRARLSVQEIRILAQSSMPNSSCTVRTMRGS